MSNKTVRIVTVALALLLLATLAFIWGNSLLSRPESQAESDRVKEIIEPVLEQIVGDGNVTDFLVRKLAHFTEFFVLGCELAALFLVRGGRGTKHALVCFALVFAVAAADETIQIFTDRGSQITDVLIDFTGAAAGIAVVWVICLLLYNRRADRAKKFHETKNNS